MKFRTSRMINSKQISLLCFLLLLHVSFPSSQAWNIPLPGGGKLSYDGTLLRIQTNKVDDLPPFPALETFPTASGSVEVRDTGTSKGFGAFCTKPLAKHAFLGFYEGEIRTNLSDCHADYIMSLDGGLTYCDGYQRAQDRKSFSPVHLNHCDGTLDECNCLRLLENGRVAFFTSRDIEVGEELSFDYGSNYWKGREDEKI